MRDAILIAGGYGVVGRRIAEDLAAENPGRVVLGGRNLARGEETARAIGHGCRARVMDVTDRASIESAIEDASVAVGCIDQPKHALLHAAVDHGLGYTDITPHLTQLGGAAFGAIGDAARSRGARIVLGTGIVPGISNVMVRALADRLGGIDAIETSLLLSATDASGPASFDYFLQELAIPFEVYVGGRHRPARPFTEPERIVFPDPIGVRDAYLFPFSDQVLYPRTTSATTVLTRLALEPSWLAKLLAFLVQTNASRIVAKDAVRKAIAERHHERDPRTDPSTHFALRVDVRRDRRTETATLLGQAQADAAAAGAAGIARLLIDGAVKPGAWMPDQIAEPEPFFSGLAKRGLKVVLTA